MLFTQPLIRRLVSTQIKYKLEANRPLMQKNFFHFIGQNSVVHKVLHWTRVLKALHVDEDCWMYGCRGGPCDYCGTGFCCRRGWFAGGCDGISGGPKKHVCVAAPPEPKEVNNLGRECMNAGRCQDGRCGYCGNGLCCRMGKAGGDCSGEVGGENHHVCIPAAPEPKANSSRWFWR